MKKSASKAHSVVASQKTGVNNSVVLGGQPQQVVIIQRGNFFNELERLKSLDNHRQKLEQIQAKDSRKAIKKDADRHDPKRAEFEKQRRQDWAR